MALEARLRDVFGVAEAIVVPTPPDQALVHHVIAAAAGAGLMWLGGALMIDEWPVTMAGAPLPAGLKFAGLCFGGALILLFALERLLTGDYRDPKATEGED